MSKKSSNNRSNQLNPNNPAYASSRLNTMTSAAVAKIQSAEVNSKGQQAKNGVGGVAQKTLAEKE